MIHHLHLLASRPLDEVLQAVAVGFVVLVFVAVLLAANLGETSSTWRIVGYAGLCGICAIVALLALLTIVATAAGTRLGPGHLTQRVLVGNLFQFAGAAAAPVALLPEVRRGLARFLHGFRPESAINAVAAALYILVVTFFLSQQISVDQLQTIKDSGQSPSLFFIIGTNQLPFLVVSFAGVGLFVRRGAGAAAERLGLYWPGWRWIAASVGVAVLLVIFGVAFDALMTRVTPEQSKAINDVSQLLLKEVSSPAAAIALALAAGIGEEIIFRGAVQPRLGIVAAAVLFAVMHTQYAVSLATLEIFILGIFLGLLRRRAGTYASIIAHGGYDLILLMIPYVYALFQ
ncbi:MAG: lysostaphin resistance A-like protein, partial [Candidatus Dormibacteria bacterium]